MDIPEQSIDPILEEFDKWLKSNQIKPHGNILGKVRENLADDDSLLERKIDTLFRQDTLLFDERLIWKIRSRLNEGNRQRSASVAVAKWLAPLAAAATLALAVISFQSRGTQPITDQTSGHPAESLAVVEIDEDMMQIMALAANLESASDITRLESVDHLSFLFE